MTIEIKTKNKTFGLYVDFDYFKNKIKTIFKNFLGAIGIIAMCLLCCIEVKDNVSVFTTALIYLSLFGLFVLGMIAINDNK